ncbi:hypothetical protein MBUL_03273 [Methylobacterium bullatum]|uniref:Uncharacterized protein n=1 Tax=Methylobacterium bullatum TaxID=570505 RepID=A0A679JA73_9HYPH|nr:hypothetical protein MBUL_03273 [Methylobacterium bullatum]
MDEGAANGAAIAHRPVGDGHRHPRHGAAREVGNAPVLDIRVGDESAEHQGLAFDGRPAQFGDAGDVEDEVRLHEAQVQHRSEGLSPGHQLHAALGGGEPGEQGGQIAGALIGKAGGFHAASRLRAEAKSRASSTASTIRCWLTGECSMATPSGRRASLMALASAAGGAMAPPSPIPFTPNCV